jgi:hypothetical protein
VPTEAKASDEPDIFETTTYFYTPLSFEIGTKLHSANKQRRTWCAEFQIFALKRLIAGGAFMNHLHHSHWKSNVIEGGTKRWMFVEGTRSGTLYKDDDPHDVRAASSTLAFTTNGVKNNVSYHRRRWGWVDWSCSACRTCDFHYTVSSDEHPNNLWHPINIGRRPTVSLHCRRTSGIGKKERGKGDQERGHGHLYHTSRLRRACPGAIAKCRCKQRRDRNYPTSFCTPWCMFV